MTIPQPLPDTGFPIPVRASFTVFKRYPLLAIASNNLAPRLLLFEDRLEHRVIVSRSHAYSDIEKIDARQRFAARNIIFHWRDGMFSFNANVGDAESLRCLLVFFAARQIPFTEEARKIMHGE